MLAEITKPGTLENIIIKAQHNCFSDNIQYSGKFIPILHEYVMIVRKDDALFIRFCFRKSGKWIFGICREPLGKMSFRLCWKAPQDL